MIERRLFVAGSLGLALPSWAHHGWSSFDQDRPLYLEGRATKVMWRNPHGEVELELRENPTLPADLIVYATGYGPMNDWAAQLISPAVAEKIGLCWGLGSDTAKDPGPWEGELRNMWKPTRQEALWFQGGNLQQARHFSLYTALQIKARMEGLPVSVYRAD